MRQSALFAALFLVLLSVCVLAQKPGDQKHSKRPVPSQHMQVNEAIQENSIEDPLRQRSEKPHKKPTHDQEIKGFPSREETAQIWGTYKPYNYDDENDKTEENVRDEDENYYAEFNELLKWGMIIGSVFMIFVLVKTCARKNGRREMRRLRQEALQNARVNTTQQQMTGYYFVQPQQSPVIINANQGQIQQQQSLDEKILNAERELQKLKAMQQESLQQEFRRKKMEEEQQKRVEALNAQRRQAFEQGRRPQNNFNVGYGPVFYGQQQSHNAHVQQPFQVKGIEPIRQRSNSFKTEISERPILANEVNYRNGIPIGKPIRQQDNDSSFASEYPEV